VREIQVDVVWHCKPLGNTDWNGSGMHSNFSTKYMREVGGKEYFEALMAAFDKYKNEHIAVYGPDNHLRLTGLHETQSIDKFNYGVANRGASIRVPQASPKTATRATWKTAGPTPPATPTKSPAASCKPSRPCQGQPLPGIIQIEAGDLHVAGNVVFLIAHRLVGRFGAELGFPPKPGVESALVERQRQIDARRRVIGAKMRIAGGNLAGRRPPR
jgi:hypothetical protein